MTEPINKPLFTLVDGPSFEHTELRECGDGLWRVHDDIVWISNDGRVWRLADMETDHLRSCVATVMFVRRNFRRAYLPHLVDELRKRTD